MTQPGRFLETDKVALGVWKRLTDQFSIWRLFWIAIASWRSLFPFQKNNLGRMLETRHWRIGLGLLGGLSDSQVEFLEQFADINARRVQYVFRAWALLMVSLPVGALVALNEIMPQVFEATIFGFLDALIAIMLVYLVVAGIIFASSWRAQDLADLLKFEKARREHANRREAAE